MAKLIDLLVQLLVSLWFAIERVRRRRRRFEEFTDVDADRDAPTLPSAPAAPRKALPTLHEYCTHCGDQVRLIGAHMLQCPTCGRSWSTDFPPSSER